MILQWGDFLPEVTHIFQKMGSNDYRELEIHVCIFFLQVKNITMKRSNVPWFFITLICDWPGLYQKTILCNSVNNKSIFLFIGILKRIKNVSKELLMRTIFVGKFVLLVLRKMERSFDVLICKFL